MKMPLTDTQWENTRILDYGEQDQNNSKIAAITDRGN
jgi:hypothetical protein